MYSAVYANTPRTTDRVQELLCKRSVMHAKRFDEGKSFKPVPIPRIFSIGFRICIRVCLSIKPRLQSPTNIYFFVRTIVFPVCSCIVGTYRFGQNRQNIPSKSAYKLHLFRSSNLIVVARQKGNRLAHKFFAVFVEMKYTEHALHAQRFWRRTPRGWSV